MGVKLDYTMIKNALGAAAVRSARLQLLELKVPFRLRSCDPPLGFVVGIW